MRNPYQLSFFKAEAHPISICVPGEAGEPGKATKRSQVLISSKSILVHCWGVMKSFPHTSRLWAL